MGTKRSALFILLGFLIFSSCSFSKETPPPPGTICYDTMRLIITDLTLTEAVLNTGAINDTLKKINVFSRYHISIERFDSSFAYYSRNPKKLKEIYTGVLENLNSK